MRTITCYLYHFKHLWIGWIMKQPREIPIGYYDNEQKVILEPEQNLAFVSIGFSRKKVIKKTNKWVEKYRAQESKED